MECACLHPTTLALRTICGSERAAGRAQGLVIRADVEVGKGPALAVSSPSRGRRSPHGAHLDAIHQTIVSEDVGGDDEFVAEFYLALAHEQGNGVFDGFVRIGS